MNAKQAVLALVALDFAALSVYALAEVGVTGMFAAATANVMSATLAVDLVISLSLAAWWMVREGRALGINAAPYVALTFLTGSLGPLLFLIKREGLKSGAPAQHPAAVAA